MPAEARPAIAFHAPLKPPDSPVPSGDRRMARLLMAALRQAGYSVSLASRFRSLDPSGDPARQARLRTTGLRLARRYAARAAEPPRAWFTYHLYYKAPDWIGPEVSRTLGIPYFVAEASFAPKRAGGPWHLGHAAVGAAVAQARAVFCLNPNDTACLRPLVGDPRSLISLPPFLDNAPYAAAAAERLRHRRAVAALLEIDPQTPWLLAVAMMRPGDKLASYRQLGQALARLLDRDWLLLVVGDGPARPEAELALRPLGARVRLLGEMPGWGLPPLYAAADLLVWPAVREAYGMALLEAQAAGLPVVAGRTDGVPAVVADGESGSLVAPGDPDAFAAAVAKLLDDGEERGEFRRAALARIRRRHTVAAAAAVLRSAMEPWL